jgi:hypothetical protein
MSYQKKIIVLYSQWVSRTVSKLWPIFTIHNVGTNRDKMHLRNIKWVTSSTSHPVKYIAPSLLRLRVSSSWFMIIGSLNWDRNELGFRDFSMVEAEGEGAHLHPINPNPKSQSLLNLNHFIPVPLTRSPKPTVVLYVHILHCIAYCILPIRPLTLHSYFQFTFPFFPFQDQGLWSGLKRKGETKTSIKRIMAIAHSSKLILMRVSGLHVHN